MNIQKTTIESPPVHDCWNRIGVEGNSTCRELIKFIHCRNCPVYSAAGLQLLDRPLPPEYRQERARHYAQVKKIAQPARLSVVIFRIGGEWLALPTAVFQEVAERRVMHTLPSRRRVGGSTRGLALGLVNVRGELLICASVSRLLGLENAELHQPRSARTRSPAPDSRNPEFSARSLGSGFTNAHTVFERLLVTSWASGPGGLPQRVAFPVDEVQGIQRIPKEDVKDPPATVSKTALTHTQGVFQWRDRTVGLLEPDAFFTALNRNLA